MKDVARSHALAEGLAEAEDITSQLGEWTLEEFAASEGIEGEGYNKAEGDKYPKENPFNAPFIWYSLNS